MTMTKAEYVRGIKENAPCHDCRGVFEWHTLSFVLPSGRKSTLTVGQCVRSGSWERLLGAVERRILLCRSCFSGRIMTARLERRANRKRTKYALPGTQAPSLPESEATVAPASVDISLGHI